MESREERGELETASFLLEAVKENRDVLFG